MFVFYVHLPALSGARTGPSAVLCLCPQLRPPKDGQMERRKH
jgi:hypothetical protein